MKLPQIHAEVAGLRIRQWQMKVVQQRRYVGAAGLALCQVADHDQMRNSQRRHQRLGWPRMNLVVQGRALRVLLQLSPPQRPLRASS